MSNKKTTNKAINDTTKAKIQNLIDTYAPKKEELRYGEGDNELVVSVYPVIPFQQRSEMIHEIVDGVFMDDKDTVATYVPGFLGMVQKFTTLKYFTDIAMPKQLDDLWLLLNYTPVFDDVAKILGDDLASIFADADKSIDTYRQYLANKSDFNSVFNKVGDSLKGLESKLSEEDVAKIMESLKGLSGGSSPEEIAKAFLGVNDKV